MVLKRAMALAGLRTQAQRAWAMYDWANSAVFTVIVTAVFPIFFSAFAAKGMEPSAATLRYSVTTTIALVVVALIAPLLGALADILAIRKRLLGLFVLAGSICIGLMGWIEQGAWVHAALLFGLVNVAVSGSFVFYDSLLPHVATPREIDRVSTAGYALGYVGGGLALLAGLGVIMRPDLVGLPVQDPAALPTRIVLAAVGVWWLLFTLPLLRKVPEPPSTTSGLPVNEALRSSLRRLTGLARELRRYPGALGVLLAFLIYNDGVLTIIRMGAVFGQEIGIRRELMIAAIVGVQFVGIPFALLFGALARRIGPRAAILIGLAVYLVITWLGYSMTTEREFIVLALLIGTVQGGVQALSRSLFGRLIPPERSGEMFGVFAVFEKFAGIFGPAVFAGVAMVTGSSRDAILALLAFFIVGGAILWRTDIPELAS